MAKNRAGARKKMVEVEIGYWENDNGTIGGNFGEGIPGVILAKDTDVFTRGSFHVMNVFAQGMKEIERRGDSAGTFDMQSKLGILPSGYIRMFWNGVPGFVIDFRDKCEVDKFIQSLLVVPGMCTFLVER